MQNQTTSSLTYYDWKITHPCGPTPEFSWAGTRATVLCSIATEDQAPSWTFAQRVMTQLAARYPILQAWATEVNSANLAAEDSPLLQAWRALQNGLKISVYPAESFEISESSTDSPVSPARARHLRIHTACPYDAFVSLSLQLTGLWLSWSHTVFKQGELNLPREQLQQWLSAFERLGTLIPPADVMALHHHLWQQGVSWQWLGGRQNPYRAGISSTRGCGCTRRPRLD